MLWHLAKLSSRLSSIRTPQSWQSVPNAQELVLEPGPPSSHTPFLAVLHLLTESEHVFASALTRFRHASRFDRIVGSESDISGWPPRLSQDRHPIFMPVSSPSHPRPNCTHFSGGSFGHCLHGVAGGNGLGGGLGEGGAAGGIGGGERGASPGEKGGSAGGAGGGPAGAGEGGGDEGRSGGGADGGS